MSGWELSNIGISWCSEYFYLSGWELGNIGISCFFWYFLMSGWELRKNRISWDSEYLFYVRLEIR